MQIFTNATEDVETIFCDNGKWPKRFKMNRVVEGKDLATLDLKILNAKGGDWYKIRKLYNEYLFTNTSIWMHTKQHFKVCNDFVNYITKNLNEKNEVPCFEKALCCWALECTTMFETNNKLIVFEKHVPNDIKSKKNQNEQNIPLNQYLKLASTRSQSRFKKIVAESDLKQGEKDVVFFDMLGAGVEITSNAASFLLYCLATNPKKQEKLRQEIKEVIGSELEITGKTLQKMQYLHAVNMEAQRLYLLTPANVRIISSDMVLSGYRVPGGSTVFLTANSINNRDPKYFDDPDSYIPERWLNGSTKNKFVTAGLFGMGARMCPGRGFALQEIGCLMITLLSRYRIKYNYEPLELSKPAQKPKFKFLPISD